MALSATPPPPLPRYAEIRRDLEGAILSGRWPPGHRVPSEHDLVARYGCSRMTVNKALSGLATAGLIVRRRRSGSFVATPAVEESVLEIHDIAAEIARGGKPYRFVLTTRAERKASARDATRLGVALRTPVLALACLHFAGNEAFAAEDRLINLDSVPAARSADFTASPPGSWLLARIPWSRAEHRISAINAPGELAQALGIARGGACLQVERGTWQAGAAITQVVLTYPGDRHHLIARFSPAGAARG
jgi:GntR family histidine utilization transcriptional repressor